jgi:hypothetical protein
MRSKLLPPAMPMLPLCVCADKSQFVMSGDRNAVTQHPATNAFRQQKTDLCKQLHSNMGPFKGRPQRRNARVLHHWLECRQQPDPGPAQSGFPASVTGNLPG